jgi:hypothetical protein
MQSFDLDQLGNWWVSLKVNGRLDASIMPLPIQSALSALGVADIDHEHNEIVLSFRGMIGPRPKQAA